MWHGGIHAGAVVFEDSLISKAIQKRAQRKVTSFSIPALTPAFPHCGYNGKLIMISLFNVSSNDTECDMLSAPDVTNHICLVSESL